MQSIVDFDGLINFVRTMELVNGGHLEQAAQYAAFIAGLKQNNEREWDEKENVK